MKKLLVTLLFIGLSSTSYAKPASEFTNSEKINHVNKMEAPTFAPTIFYRNFRYNVGNYDIMMIRGYNTISEKIYDPSFIPIKNKKTGEIVPETKKFSCRGSFLFRGEKPYLHLQNSMMYKCKTGDSVKVDMFNFIFLKKTYYPEKW